MSETNIEIKTDLSPSERLFDAASTRGFELDKERADRLVKKAEYTASLGELTSYIFEENGLQIKHPIRMGVSGVPISNVSRLDFLPQVDKDSNIVANPTPQRGSTTQITLMGIEAFQDFVLVADAGLVEKPDRFFGTTNPTMAKFAERLGFEKTPRVTDGVTATFEVVAEKIFSPEILEIQQRLEERQTALTVGSLALTN
jgi:hypothetical protein